MPTSDPNCAILCSCSQRGLIPSDSVNTTRDKLTSQGWQVTVIPDLCEMAIKDSDTLRDLASAPNFLVTACRSRAARWLLHQAGISRPVSQIQFQDIRPQPSSPLTSANPSSVNDSSPSWPAWFPVIDYDRCTGCRQCVSFCAFGVYSISGKTVNVTAPSNCKDNCPACARICPALAIMFPKVTDTPINGDEVTDSHLAAMRASIATAKRDGANGDMHSILAARRARQPASHQDGKASSPA